MTAEGRVSFEEIAPLLGQVKPEGEWLMSFCPCHSDGQKHDGRNGQSLGLSKAGVLRCFAGCEFADVIKALRERSGVVRANGKVPTPIKRGEAVQTRLYEYRTADGVLMGEKGRFEGPGGKSFRWRQPGEVGWPATSGLKMADMPLYGSDKLAFRPDESVYLVEGEKACEACWQQGLLTVSTPGGASQKDFGKALNVLKARTVVLWPDNDPAGRDFMALIQAQLGPIAATVRLVDVASLSLKEKGDAFDYFASGHTAEEIESRSPTEPSVQLIAVDAVRVLVPSMVGIVTCEFTEMEKTQRSLEAEVSVSLGTIERPYMQRLNLLSASGVTDMRRDLEEMYGKQAQWTRVLNTAVAVAREAFVSQDRGKDVFEIADNDAELLLMAPFIVAEGATIFFGDGGSNKSYLAQALCWCLALGLPFAGYRPISLRRVLYVDYEDSESNFKKRARRILASLAPELEEPPPFCLYYWSAAGIPLHDQLDSLKRKIEREGIGLVVIDSVAEACGGKPEDADVALRFFRTLKRIGVPAILIAHVTKQMDAKKPFGSGFWHNEARRTWYVHRIQEEESDEIDVGLYNRKVNDGQAPAPISLHISFKGQTGPVNFRVQAMDAVPELMESTSARNRVWAVLHRPMTIRQIATETGLGVDAIESVFRRDREHFLTVGQAREGRQTANLYSKSVSVTDGPSTSVMAERGSEADAPSVSLSI